MEQADTGRIKYPKLYAPGEVHRIGMLALKASVILPSAKDVAGLRHVSFLL
jgi:hypothetical protein